MVEELIIYHKFFYINYLIQYLLLYKVIYFCCSVFWGAVWEGRLLWFMYMLVSIASALFYVYACEYCLYVLLLLCFM